MPGPNTGRERRQEGDLSERNQICFHMCKVMVYLSGHDQKTLGIEFGVPELGLGKKFEKQWPEDTS